MQLILEDYKIPSWNSSFSRGHWSKRQEMNAEACQEIWISLHNKGMMKGNVLFDPYVMPVSITITAHLKRPIDCDNVMDKPIIDALKFYKVIQDDSPKYVKSVTTKVVKSKKNYVVIDIQ